MTSRAIWLLALVLLAGCAEQPTTRPTTPLTTPLTTPPPTRPTAPPTTPPAAGPGERWAPAPGIAWQWQLDGELDLSVDVPVYDIDGERTSAAQVAELHRLGRRAICYVNVGAYEDFRPDRDRFPADVLGRPLDGWPNERWLDIRRWDVLEPIMTTRFEACQAKGFDAVEPDNVDGYSNESGFPLTAQDQLTFNRRIADLAHRLALSVGLKNDVEQADDLEPYFDFAVNEECMRYDECESLRVFVRAGKAVLHVEYDLRPDEFCGRARELGFSSMRKPLMLGPDREPC